jgi:hypothetical protein
MTTNFRHCEPQAKQSMDGPQHKVRRWSMDCRVAFGSSQ